VIAIVVLVSLLLAPADSGSAAAPASCETFTRSSGTLPPLVRDWLAHSADQRVLMCPQPVATGSDGGTPLYFGEGALSEHGTVCTYLRHGLTLAGSGSAASLQRYDLSEAHVMALAGAECPAPHASGSTQGYVETYDVSTAAFVGIMRLWSAVATAPAAAPSGSEGARAAAETRARLQAALGTRTSAATVTRIVRIPGSVLRHRYALFIKAPDAPAGTAARYVLYVDKKLRGPYEPTAFAETN
jgi:hypothetical protein